MCPMTGMLLSDDREAEGRITDAQKVRSQWPSSLPLEQPSIGFQPLANREGEEDTNGISGSSSYPESTTETTDSRDDEDVLSGEPGGEGN